MSLQGVYCSCVVTRVVWHLSMQWNLRAGSVLSLCAKFCASQRSVS